MSQIKDKADWVLSNGMWLTIQEHLGEVDRIAEACEQTYGVGMLRLLVDLPLREKFDRQRVKLNHAIWNGPLEALITEARRMGIAWQALRRDAEAQGLWSSPEAWEAQLEGGGVLVLYRTDEEANAHRPKAPAPGRYEVVWSLPEVARLLGDKGAQLQAIKRAWPGAMVQGLKPFAAARDPVPSIEGELDDPINF